MRIPILVLLALTPVLLPSHQPASQPKELFFDDFSGPSLDRTRWNVVVTGKTVNNEQQAYVDSPDVFTFISGNADGASDGALGIRPRFREGFTTQQGRRFDFVSGRADTKDKLEFMHGKVTARIKLSVGAGLWPAFWILGTGDWPATGEIDVMEHVGEPDWTSVAIHGPGYSGNTPLVSRIRMDAADGPSNWHVYGVEWTSEAMVFSVDGREVYRATRAMIESHGPWAFDNKKYLILNLALGGNYPRSVNKADRPYPGLPAATVDLIKQNKVQFLVDWVRVVGL
ncbi:MAG TPA: glycoside hydrolase family 16 protein [Vicinamibacterales bacterium]|nr:glycoside hydrolase family 16 protein [Vicinamibacterales bacterium]